MKFNYIKSLFLITLSTSTTNVAMAQQEPLYTQYMHNAISVNPGYAGSREMLSVGVVYRTQWVGLAGAPNTQNFFVHTPIPNTNMGVGLSLVNDRIGPTNQQWLNLDYSYALKFKNNARLAFGMKASANRTDTRLTPLAVDQLNDPSQTDIAGVWTPNFGAGAYYSSDKWYAGLSVPRLVKNDYGDTRELEALHYYLIGGYVFDLNPDLKLKTSLLSRVSKGTPFSADLNASFLLYKTLWLGVGHRWEESVSFLAGFQLQEKLYLGYSYDYQVGSLSSVRNGSHEIMLTYDFNVSKKMVVSPRYF